MRWRIAIACAAVGLAIAVLWWLTRDPGDASDSAPARTVATSSRTAAPQLAAGTPAPARANAGINTDDPLTFYKKANVYPPTSHPLTPDMQDLIAPNKRHEQPMVAESDSSVSYLFTADRYFVIGDQTLTAILDVRRGDKPIAFTVNKMFITVLDPVSHNEMPIPVAFDPKGTVIAPAKLALQRQAAIGVYVEFSYGTGIQRSHFDFQYTPTTGIPARFTGEFREAVVNGSLVIYAGMDVTTAGDYLVDCNLYDSADRPVAWTRFKESAGTGSQEAALLFFGKVLVDGGVPGPYHIGELRGARYDPTKDPDLEQIPPYGGTYTTQPYPLSAFSSAEWDSPEKQRMLQFLSQQKAAGIMQGGATPADPGTPGPPK